MTALELATSYGSGRGIKWMYEKRLEGMGYAGLVYLRDGRVVLTPRGRKVAGLFAVLRKLARLERCGGRQ
jgi:hypothetical protein